MASSTISRPFGSTQATVSPFWRPSAWSPLATVLAPASSSPYVTSTSSPGVMRAMRSGSSCAIFQKPRAMAAQPSPRNENTFQFALGSRRQPATDPNSRGRPMRGAILRATGDETLDVVDDLTLDSPGPSQVQIQIEATGLCHSDL